MTRYSLLFAAVSLIGGGCTFGVDQCGPETPCLSGQCVEGQCIPLPEPEPDAGPSPDAGEPDTYVAPDAPLPPDAGPDAPEPDLGPDAPVTPDAGPDAEPPTPDMGPDAPSTPECVSNDDCGDGLLCLEGACTECTEDEQCPEDRPLCDTAADPNQCVECIVNADCPSAACTGTVCFAGRCVTVPGGELCDGQDNNCDGVADEVFTDLGTSCSDGIGACQALGTNACLPSGLGTFCTAVASTPSSELCNGLDDNCNGSVDEGFGDLNCGVGNCAATTLACIGGVPQTCVPNAPTPEVCDSRDNDCDGTADEELGSTTCGLGVCSHTVENCVGGVPTFCNPFEGSSSEACDGLDNNCDGDVDEGFGTTTCGLGVCEHTLANCVDGELQTCDPLTGASPETCNGLDDNCNGSVDEGFGDLTCGVGNCAATTPACIGGVPQTCTPNAPTPEVCDSRDNDCDGIADEGLLTVFFADGDGDGFGNSGSFTTACTVPSGHVLTPTDCNDSAASVHPGADEVCGNSVDEDCDGSVDEGCAPPPAACSCTDGDADGFFSVGCTDTDCSPRTDCNDANPLVNPSGTEVCNTLDDDCDGTTDEGGVCPVVGTVLVGKNVGWTPPSLDDGLVRAGLLYVTACGSTTALCTAGTATSTASTIASCFIPLANIHCYNESVDVSPYAASPQGLDYGTGDRWHCNFYLVPRFDGTYVSEWVWRRPDGTTFTSAETTPTCKQQAGGGNNDDETPPAAPPS